jgi:hypothetical protein
MAGPFQSTRPPNKSMKSWLMADPRIRDQGAWVGPDTHPLMPDSNQWRPRWYLNAKDAAIVGH